MTSLLTGARRGVGAGAAGTTVLNAVTYTDMAVRARPASDAPQDTVAALARQAGAGVPGRGSTRTNRLQGLGGLSGAVTGLAVGGVAGVLRAAGVRLPTAIGGPLLGAVAMLATDLPMARLGLTDPRLWSRADWIADAVPHLCYGVATHAVLVSSTRADEQKTTADRAPSTPDLLRAAAVGAATGCRSSIGLTSLALRSTPGDRGPAGRLGGTGSAVLHALTTAGELVWDKHPSIPARTSGQGLAPRVTLGGLAAGAAARRGGVESGVPGLVGAAAAVATSLGGIRARAAAQQRFGSDLPGALIEDGVGALLAWVGTGRSAAT